MRSLFALLAVTATATATATVAPEAMAGSTAGAAKIGGNSIPQAAQSAKPSAPVNEGGFTAQQRGPATPRDPAVTAAMNGAARSSVSGSCVRSPSGTVCTNLSATGGMRIVIPGKRY